MSFVSPLPGHLTNQQADQALNALSQMNATDAHDLALMMLDTGMRSGELLREFRWKHIFFSEDGRMTIKFSSGKSSTFRVIPLSDRAASVIVARRGNPQGPFITGRASSSREAIASAFCTACEKAGVPRVALHSLRHTFGHAVLSTGASFCTLMSVMGYRCSSSMPCHSKCLFNHRPPVVNGAILPERD